MKRLQENTSETASGATTQYGYTALGIPLAARRAGKRRVILSRENENDLRDLPDYVRDDMEFILVETVEDVLKDALLPCSRRARWPQGS